MKRNLKTVVVAGLEAIDASELQRINGGRMATHRKTPSFDGGPQGYDPNHKSLIDLAAANWKDILATTVAIVLL